MIQVLYISYDGMTDSLGRSQVLPYLEGLAKRGYKITLISAEKPQPFAQYGKSTAELISNMGIDWQSISYTKRPPIVSTLIDVLKIRRLALKLHSTKQFSIVHCRSYIAAFIGLLLQKRHNCRFVFDMRGFYADERVDGQIWNTKKIIYKLVYNYFKKKEKTFMSCSDAIISLTQNAKKEILTWNLPKVYDEKITVIPCCADLQLFDYNQTNSSQTQQLRTQLNISSNQFVISYLGSVGTWYMLPQMFDFFMQLQTHKPDAVFLLITRDNKQSIIAAAKAKGINEQNLRIVAAQRNEVPKLLSLSNASVFFIKPAWSKKASSPTKLAELMGMGIPTITNRGVGDVDIVMEQNPSGYLINDWTTNCYEEIITKLLSNTTDTRQATRELANNQFSLIGGVNKYAAVYEQIM